ncbi:hypothetical protein BDR05DRAFT_972912 [Suillus weaverae]|nr:hypothetical protein BDR05DRAFT_972912 [Suillus weaverae]
MKDWNSPIIEHGGQHAHEFKCLAKGCKTTVRCYLDKGDARLTGNMRKHTHLCWGDDVLQVTDQARDADEVQKNIVGSVLAEIVHWVAESLCPFKIVQDRGFQSLMKTGQPEYYLPSSSTVSQDVQLVFVQTHQHIAKMMKEYEGKINFTTDG